MVFIPKNRTSKTSTKLPIAPIFSILAIVLLIYFLIKKDVVEIMSIGVVLIFAGMVFLCSLTSLNEKQALDEKLSFYESMISIEVVDRKVELKINQEVDDYQRLIEEFYYDYYKEEGKE